MNKKVISPIPTTHVSAPLFLLHAKSDGGGGDPFPSSCHFHIGRELPINCEYHGLVGACILMDISF